MGRRTGRDRLIEHAAVLIAAAGIVAAGCSSSDARTDGASAQSTTRPAASSTSGPHTTTPSPSSSSPVPTTVWSLPADAFASTDSALDARVASAGLPGGTIRVVADDGTVLHEHSTGSVTASTPLDVASSSKWLTAATLMTFVDRGAVALDDDIARWLPEFAGSDPPIRVRQLLDHTSGVHDNDCQNGGVALAACVTTLASSPREFAAGSAFSYGNSPYLVVGRLIEVLGGADFASVVQDRLTGPLGMAATTWPGAPGAPNPAFGAQTTVDDYGKFLAMLLHGGMAGGTRVLSAAAVHEITRNQVADYDTTHDYSVGITGIPRYGLGCWIDEQGTGGATRVVSGNGGKGLYPWVDFTTRTWGVVGVQDDRGAEFAVPASQAVELEARAELRP
jgi:CubicO group peptidase (beta-lactamase class C family)